MRPWYKFFGFIVLLYLIVSFLLYLFQESLIFQSSELDQNYKFEFDTPFEEINIETQDKAILNALYFKCLNPKGIILYFHGNAGDLSRWGNVIKPFLKMHYEVLIMDYRGYGKSNGNRTEELMYEDAMLFYKKAREQYEESQIILYGRSLGTTFAIFVASKNYPKQLILETPFYSLQSIVESAYPIFPTKSLLEFIFPNYQFVREVKCPITIFHGTEDRVVPYENGKKLLKQQPSVNFVTIPKAGHNNIAGFEKYWIELEKLLN